MKKTCMVVALVVFITTSFAILTILPVNVKAATLYVGGGGPGNYTTIQGAVDAASPGDTVYVYNGTYYENVVVDKSLNLIGEDMDTTVVDGGRIGDTIFASGDSVKITGFTVTGSRIFEYSAGINLYLIQNGEIARNNISNNMNGIYLQDSDGVTITGNNISNNWWGINAFSSMIAITGNNISKNEWGILFSYSYSVIVTGNNISNNGCGLCLESSGGTIENNDISNNGWGIDVAPASSIPGWPPSGVYVKANNITNNIGGISFSSSQHVGIGANNITNNERGFYVWNTTDAYIGANNISNNERGIRIWSSTDVYIEANSISINGEGIGLDVSTDVTINRNTFISNGVFISGDSLPHFNSHVVSTENSVNGKPLHYYRNCNGLYMDGIPVGQLIVANCTDVTATNLEITDTDVGIQMAFANLVTVTANDISNNTRGIHLYSSTVVAVHHNNFLSNRVQAYDNKGNENSWDDGYPSGGNYWSDYSGTDLYRGSDQNIRGRDGIGDTPYVIDSDSFDRYPLVSPGVVFPCPPSNVTASLSGRGFENVTIDWDPSPDESLGLVERYDILRGENYNTSASLYTNIGSVPNGTRQFVAAFTGEGNPNTYFFTVCAVNITNDSTCADNQVGKFTRSFSAGSNLISVPFIQSNESVETVLQTVEYDKAWYYDPSSKEWIWYMKYKEYRRGLFNINHTTGIWVNVTQDSNLTVAGIVPAQTTIQLYQGWNLVSFPSFNASYAVSDFKIDTGAVRVEGYDSTPPYHLRVLGDAEVLLAGNGYWVKVQADVDWIAEVS